MCAHVIAVTTCQFSVFSDCEHLVVWVSVSFAWGKVKGGGAWRINLGQLATDFWVQRYSSSSFLDSDEALLPFVISNCTQLHGPPSPPPHPQFSHAHPHTTNYCSLIGQNVCLCTCTQAHTMRTSLPARFLPLGSQFHQVL